MLREIVARLRSVAVVAAAGFGVALLSACGVKGPLTLPPKPPPATATPSSEPPTAPAATPSDTAAPRPPERKP
jgi:predicted small lipoprotein YifL